MYYAHSIKSNINKYDWQKLADHLQSTGQLAAEFASSFGFENAALLAGLLHDLGKYSVKFQKRLEGSSQKVDHSTAGAKIVRELVSQNSNIDKLMVAIISYCIAGHHAGLADFDELCQRLENEIEALDEIWKSEISPQTNDLFKKEFKPANSDEARSFQLGFLCRMLFSCLVDADFKDTEKFYCLTEGRETDRNWEKLQDNIDILLAKFQSHMDETKGKAKPSLTNDLRAKILETLLEKAAMPKGIFTLTVPTGGGKTLASLGFALSHAKHHGMQRIIYSIPFTSIIDQNAVIFREVLEGGMENNFILEHHSNIEEEKFDPENPPQQRDKLKLAMEDWAAPVIVTTNVQFFESLFSNRPSKCRKLKNLANSIIILDEVQTLPTQYLRPCLAALDELARNYGATIILCSATQPAVDKRNFKYGDGLELEGRELAPNPDMLAKQLKRVNIEHSLEFDDEELLSQITAASQALIIVNSRKHALEFYQLAKRQNFEGIYHLSTRQYAGHRREILAEVRQRLKDELPCRLIATSLVEAGVDLDFPKVWREEAGLDSITQAAGRCNREGKRPIEESIVRVFRAKDYDVPREIARNSACFHRMKNDFEDLLSPAAVKRYFEEMYWVLGADELDKKSILKNFERYKDKAKFDFRKTSNDFNLIESGLLPIIIHEKDNKIVAEVLGRLNGENVSAGKAARDLQAFTVQVPRSAHAELIASGKVKYYRQDLWGNQFAVLEGSDVEDIYSKEQGLIWELKLETIF